VLESRREEEQNPRMIWISVALMILGISRPAAPEISPVGYFDNVRSTRSEEPHCYGWSLDLWRHKDRLFGLLDHHDGLCGDPPCEAVAEITLEPKTRRLTFSAFGLPFTGSLRRNEIVGTLGRERVRLMRNNERTALSTFQTLDGWCRFWRGVPRCKRVSELCDSLGVAAPFGSS
jgi:hypothetical protein